MKNSASVTALESKRSARITADDVYQAADALLIDGQKPTIQGVRAKLGRGSPNTVQEHLDQWWTLLGRRILGSPGEPLPLPKPVSDTLLQLWSTALREAQEAIQHSLETRESAALASATELNVREANLIARERALEESGAAMKDALTALRHQQDEQRTRVGALEKQLETAQHELRDAEKRLQQEQTQYRALQQALQEANSQRLHDRTDADRHIAATESRAAREIDRARQETRELQRKSSEIEKTLRAEIKERRDDQKSKAREFDAVQNAYRELVSLQTPERRKVKPKMYDKRRSAKSTRRASVTSSAEASR